MNVVGQEVNIGGQVVKMGGQAASHIATQAKRPTSHLRCLLSFDARGRICDTDTRNAARNKRLTTFDQTDKGTASNVVGKGVEGRGGEGRGREGRGEGGEGSEGGREEREGREGGERWKEREGGEGRDGERRGHLPECCQYRLDES